MALEQQQQPVREPAPEHWSHRVWPQLLPELAQRIVGCLEDNQVAVTFRSLNKATAQHFSGPQHTTIRISQPVPPHAFEAHWLAPGATRGLTLEARKKLVRLVAASGVLPNLEVALRAAGFVEAVAEAFQAAAGAGQLPMCQWLWDHSRSRTEDLHGTVRCSAHEAMGAAAGGGHRHVCEWLLAVNRDALRGQWGHRTICAAARAGHMDLAESLIPQDPALMSKTHAYLRCVAHGCDLPALQRAWLRLGPCLDLVADAAGGPTPDWAAKVEWLEAQGCRRRADAAWYAAGLPNGNGEALARLTWLRGRGYPVDIHAVVSAAHCGNTATLRYLLPDVPAGAAHRTENVVGGAAGGGHLAALQALHAAGWPIQPHVQSCTIAAARRGHLHVLVWLLEALGPEAVTLDAELFSVGAESGSMELLAWLRQRGCPWDAGAYSGAAVSGCEAALEWLAERACPMEASGQPYIRACHNGDVATVRCLRRLGVPWGPVGGVFVAAVWGHFLPAPLPMLRWLLEEGCPVDYEAAREAVCESGAVRPQRAAEVLQLLDEHLRSRHRPP
ncbi:hypothetical protein GPECTOR_11g27 [Gonium pectorale]|uniref:Ankyrin repeat domain-containing protein n=1 Tax=Gonium pectorale TaxID=33097 RepID=A0A150GR66_GONPE|nr:hypothetical protein GPECTOR_11g27 [Gonium pectorale]|eukprot:KXZ51830.1 hypothetical protein GPECTOR_11g27 [Gonium pectorale]